MPLKGLKKESIQRKKRTQERRNTFEDIHTHLLSYRFFNKREHKQLKNKVWSSRRRLL